MEHLNKKKNGTKRSVLANIKTYSIYQFLSDFELFLKKNKNEKGFGIGSVNKIINKWCKKYNLDENSFFKNNKLEISNVALLPIFLFLNKKLYNWNNLYDMNRAANIVLKNLKKIECILEYDSNKNNLIDKKVLGFSEGLLDHNNIGNLVREQKYISNELVRLSKADLKFCVSSKGKKHTSNKPPVIKQIFPYVHCCIELYNKLNPTKEVLKYTKNSPMYKFIKDLINHSVFKNYSETTIYTTYQYCLMGYGISNQGKKKVKYKIDGKINLLEIKNKKDFFRVLQKANNHFIKEIPY